MRFLCYILILLGVLSFAGSDLMAVLRFPPPDFESDYQLPQTAVPQAQMNWFEYVDTAVLLVTLLLTAYLVFKKRSRRAVFAVMVFSLVYFGFWRKGCVCSVGALGNVVLMLFNSNYVIPVFAMLFFLLPLIFSLFFGRVFCASVCPLGAIQDLVLIRPVKVPKWLESSLRLFAWLYLALAVLAAATDSGFLICRYDPFVGFFRLNANANMIIAGVCLLITGMFVGRPYCRFICPYGVLLGICSALSKKQVVITTDTCINCSLCADACPFGAINRPAENVPAKEYKWARKRLILLILLLLVLITAGTGLGYKCRNILARMNYTVRLAERMVLEEAGTVKGTTDETEAFRGSGRTLEFLLMQASQIRQKFALGAGILGGFMGMIIGIKLISVSVFRAYPEFYIDQVHCMACARCYDSCPQNRQNNKYARELTGS